MKKAAWLLGGLWILIGIFGRFIPHLPNMTPLAALGLVASSVFSRRLALLLMLAVMVVSDIILSITLHVSVLGSWTPFTYSGMLAVVVLGFALRNRFTLLRALGYAGAGSIGYWLWTNFGTWLMTDLYHKSLPGLLACYVAGLPFLSTAVAGTLLWTAVFTTGIAYAKRHHWVANSLECEPRA